MSPLIASSPPQPRVILTFWLSTGEHVRVDITDEHPTVEDAHTYAVALMEGTVSACAPAEAVTETGSVLVIHPAHIVAIEVP